MSVIANYEMRWTGPTARESIFHVVILRREKVKRDVCIRNHSRVKYRERPFTKDEGLIMFTIASTGDLRLRFR
jgi:hypothetical protein